MIVKRRWLAIGSALAALSSLTGASAGAVLALAFPKEEAVDVPAPVQTFDARADTETNSWTETARALPNSLVAAEHEAERLASERAYGSSARLEAPEESGLLLALTNEHLAPDDREAFHLTILANRHAESGERGAGFSTLRTTAGLQHRASYGAAQLNIRELLTHVSRLPDAFLEELGMRRSELDPMLERGRAVAAWYRLLVEHSEVAASAQVLGLQVEVARRFESMDLERDRLRLVSEQGDRFARTTGLGPAAILELADTAALRMRARREEFQSLYVARFHASFDPAHRNLERMTSIARAMARSHSDLDRILVRLGGVEEGTPSLSHYLAVGDVAENLYGWYARAASSAVGADRYRAILQVAEPVASRLRELANFEHAVAAIAKVGDLRGSERLRMLARIGRCFHGAPSRARQAFFENEDYARPRARTAADVEALVLEYRLSRTWSDDRVQRAFDALLIERGIR